MPDMIRQGDILLRPVSPLAAAVSRQSSRQIIDCPDGRAILAEGEATGHHHSVALSRGITLFRDDGGGSGGGIYLENRSGAPVALEHQEHTALPVAPGVHEVIRQRVFSAGMARQVAD